MAVDIEKVRFTQVPVADWSAISLDRSDLSGAVIATDEIDVVVWQSWRSRLGAGVAPDVRTRGSILTGGIFNRCRLNIPRRGKRVELVHGDRTSPRLTHAETT